MRKPNTKRQQDLLSGTVLLLLLLGAYIPVGFMPAAGTPFLLELCPVAAPLPTSMLMPAHHHHQGGTHGHFDACPFGSAPGAGPLSQVIVFSPPARAASFLDVISDSAPIARRSARAHPARGPPSPA